MNVNKKLDRLKQWAGERMGGEVKTCVSEDFKALEAEMDLRCDGMRENQKAMNSYIKAISYKNEGENKDKVLPVGFMGTAMANHGEDFENESEFGQCLIAMGQTNQRLGRVQETYITKSTSTWLESCERSLAQMKEYQAARKKLESRRLAYDTALAKMQKAKREDYRAEEELRSQKVKYEETSEDVYRRMQDIKEAEADSVADLGDFLDAELNYHDRCREMLLQLKRDWPAERTDPTRRPTRSRSNTSHIYADRFSAGEQESEMPPPQPERPSIRSNRAVSSVPQSPKREFSGYDFGSNRPEYNRYNTYEGSTQFRDSSPAPVQRISKVPSDSLSIRTQKAQLRSVSRVQTDCYDSDGSTYYSNSTSSPDRYFDERAPSPATSHGSAASRSFSSSTLSSMNGKKAPPPPPPSRAKKPPPPPPPMKRTAIGVDA